MELALSTRSARVMGMTKRHNAFIMLMFLDILVISYCQKSNEYGGEESKKRNKNNQVSPGLVGGIVVMVLLLTVALSVCILCKRCSGKKQRELKKRKYAVPSTRPASGVSRHSFGDANQASDDANLSRSSTAVSMVSIPSTSTRMQPGSSIEVIGELEPPEDHPPSPFAVIN